MTELPSVKDTQKGCVLGALLGLLGGVMCALFGAGTIAFSWFVQEAARRQTLDIFGGEVMCGTIPLLFVGAFFLDKLESSSASANKQG